jgi:hypothetical protein
MWSSLVRGDYSSTSGSQLPLQSVSSGSPQQCISFAFGEGSIPLDSHLHRELWTSWASLLRSYAAMHGLNSTHHALVEVGANEIILRVDTRWLRFTQTEQQSSQGHHQPFTLHEDGTVTLGGTTDEMDMTAEAVTRGLFQNH